MCQYNKPLDKTVYTLMKPIQAIRPVQIFKNKSLPFKQKNNTHLKKTKSYKKYDKKVNFV